MRKLQRSLVLVAAAGILAAGVARADSGDGGDNGMTPYYGDSWAALEAHDPSFPVPSMQAFADRAQARASWERARANLRDEAQHLRERVTHTTRRTDDNGN